MLGSSNESCDSFPVATGKRGDRSATRSGRSRTVFSTPSWHICFGFPTWVMFCFFQLHSAKCIVNKWVSMYCFGRDNNKTKGQKGNISLCSFLLPDALVINALHKHGFFFKHQFKTWLIVVNYGNFMLNGYWNNESFDIPNIQMYQRSVCCHKYVPNAFTSLLGYCDTLMQ